MKIDTDKFRIRAGEKVKLSRRRTSVGALTESHKHYKKAIAQKVAEIAEQQRLLYGNGNHSLLLIFQAMDAAGKDSAITHVMSGVNPQGCQVFSFKHPSAEELGHDFLWRTTRNLPARGQIGIFNRSYYEEVLIVRVQREILRAERLPAEASSGGKLWRQRYQSIREMERHLHRNGTQIIKFFSLETMKIVDALPRIDDAALKREEEEAVFGRLRAIGVRLHQRVHGPEGSTGVEWIPDEVTESAEGYVVTMLDKSGRAVEQLHLDRKETVVRRVSL